MAAVLIIPTKFTAVDKFTPVMRKMTASTSKFTRKARAGFQMVGIAERKMRTGFDKSIKRLGKLGRLAAGFSLLLIASTILKANIELDQSLQSLQAITGVTGEAFGVFREEIDRVSKSQKIFAADTAKAFELVGSAKPVLLGNARALGEVTEAAILLGKAGKLEIEPAVKSLTVSMNQFGVEADLASEFVDILATAQQKGSGTISFLSEAMVNAGGTARAFGNSFADTVAILEGFAKAGVPASEAGTMLAGILSKLSKVSNKDFNPQFTKATDIIDNLAKANLSYTDLLKMTDVRGAKWLTTIINQNDEVQRLTGNLNEVGNAQAQADLQTASLGRKIDELKWSFQNATTSTDESNFAMSTFKWILTVIADNMGILVGVIGSGIAAYGTLKAVMWATKVAMVAYNIAVGISTALQGGSAMALRASSAAMLGYKVVLAIYTGVQWLANAALWAFPLTWIVAAIIGVIAAIAALIIYWEDIVNWIKTSDNWFAKLIRFSLKPIILLFKAIKFAINLVVESFKALVEWVKTSDNWFAKFVRFTLEAMAFALGKIGDALSCVWDWWKKLASSDTMMNFMEFFMGKQPELRAAIKYQSEGGEAVNPDAAIEGGRIDREEKISNQNVDINIKAPEGLVEEIESDTGDIPIKLTPTM